ncbi:olfactory receptor 52K1-like [Periophthalmus magnuspinnatus]|uniref:olfactory receptor 52K1-like n=1 Tax=Periophthalmus magnuspinnatus TaxID=409849 RepID=UPI00145B53EC|nr:olfactory receptor 52K1-like [Periophthalmus magnuspinnatus]
MANITSHTVFELSCFLELGRLRPLLFLPLSLFYFLSLGANFLLVFVILRHRSLQSPMYLLIAGMACVDGALPLLVLSPLLLSFLWGWTQMSLGTCLLQMFVVHLLGAFQSTILLWMAVDRCLAVVCPLRYSARLSGRVLLGLAVPLVLRNVTLISGLVVLVGRLHFCDFVLLNCFCEHMAVVRLACGDTSLNSALGLLTIGLVPVLDFILIAVSYVVVLATALSGRIVTKATNTVVTHIIVMSISLAVILVAFISYRVHHKLPHTARLLCSALYLFLPSTTNPLAFGIRTQEIRKQILHLLRPVFYLNSVKTS